MDDAHIHAANDFEKNGSREPVLSWKVRCAMSQLWLTDGRPVGASWILIFFPSNPYSSCPSVSASMNRAWFKLSESLLTYNGSIAHLLKVFCCKECNMKIKGLNTPNRVSAEVALVVLPVLLC